MSSFAVEVELGAIVADNPAAVLAGNKRVILADDHQLILDGLARLLQDHYEVVARATDGRGLVDLVDEHKPDFVLADISMPGLNGVEAIRRIRSISPGSRVIVVTQHNDRQYMRAAFGAGASGYVLKQSASSELLRAIEEITNDRYYISPLLLQPAEASRFDPTVNPGELFGGKLTARQREVVQLVAEGLPAKQIAFRLNISTKTVEFHKAAVMQQLGFRSTAELIRFAVETGMVHSSCNKE